MLERKGMIVNHKKLYLLYRDEGLSVKRRRGRKPAQGTRAPMSQAGRPNARWSLDYLSDSNGASPKFRILAVIDYCSRENLCLIADTSISAGSPKAQLIGRKQSHTTFAAPIPIFQTSTWLIPPR